MSQSKPTNLTKPLNVIMLNKFFCGLSLLALTSCPALAASQSSGTRWPVVTPRSTNWWRIATSNAGPNFTASSILDRMMG